MRSRRIQEIGLSLKYVETRTADGRIALRTARDKGRPVIVRLPSKVRVARSARSARGDIYPANTDKENTSGLADAVKRGESINKFRTKFYYRTRTRTLRIADERFVRPGKEKEPRRVQ